MIHENRGPGAPAHEQQLSTGSVPDPPVPIGLGRGVEDHLFLLQHQIASGTVWQVKAG